MSMHKKIKIFRVLILVTFLIMVSAGLLLSIFKMEDVVYANGEVGGINDYEFKSMVDGKITEILKDDGARVNTGEIILKLDSTELEDRIEMVKNSIFEIEAELKVKEDSLFLLKADPLPSYYRNIEIDLDEARKRLVRSSGKLERCKELFDRKVISKTEFENVEVEYIKNKATVEKAESDFQKVSTGMGEKIVSQAENEMKLLKVKLENRCKELKLLERHLADYTIKAPEGGIVIYMPYKPSRYVQKGDLLCRMTAVKQKKYVAYVDERKIYKIHPGQKVKINSRSYNYYNFGYFKGKVLEIGEIPVRKNDAYYYPVEIAITDEPYNLKLGSTAEIMIVTGRERIIACLLGLNN
jgi:multidrug resistance efflux pump